MTKDSGLAFCNNCQRDVVPKEQPIHHGSQLRLCLITFGLWLPIWLALCFSPRQTVCPDCGEPVGRPPGDAGGAHGKPTKRPGKGAA